MKIKIHYSYYPDMPIAKYCASYNFISKYSNSFEEAKRLLLDTLGESPAIPPDEEIEI